ncbi:MAG: hypothetical protein ACI38Y_01685, partial [Candidatus Methanomethylophilaceae archaeon]
MEVTIENNNPWKGSFFGGIVLVLIGEPEQDGKWYPVTVVQDGAQGYMRNYLLTEISQADAQERMARLLASQNGGQQGEPEGQPADVQDETSQPEGQTTDGADEGADQPDGTSGEADI